MEIKILNYFNCSIKKLKKIFLENVHFDCKKDEKKINYLFVFNDFQNSKEIDLETVLHIEKKRINICYLFNNIILEDVDETHLKNKLNNFVNSPLNYESPFFINRGPFIKRFIKVSEIFYTYYLNFMGEPSGKCFYYVLFIVFGIFILFEFYIKMHIIIIIILIIIEVSFIIIYIIKRNKIERFDIIYSKDFKKVFIGFLKGESTKYDGYVKLEKEEVQQFNLKKENNKKHIFEIVLNNNSHINLCDVPNKYVDNYFRELFVLLNDKFNIKYTYEEL